MVELRIQEDRNTKQLFVAAVTVALTVVCSVSRAQTSSLPSVTIQGANVPKEHAVEDEHALQNSVQTCMAMDAGADNSADSSNNAFEATEKYMHMAQCAATKNAAEVHVVELCKSSRKPAEAIQACTEVLDLKLLSKGYEYLPLTCRALAYIEADDFTDANKDLDAAIALNPKYAVAYYLRADAMSKLGDRQAVANLQTAVSLDPSLAKLVQIQGRTVTLQLPLNRG